MTFPYITCYVDEHSSAALKVAHAFMVEFTHSLIVKDLLLFHLFVNSYLMSGSVEGSGSKQIIHA